MSQPFSPAQVERWAAGVAWSLLILVIALLCWLLVLRLYRKWREPRRQAKMTHFQDVLMQVALGHLAPTPLPGLDQADRWELLKLWLHVQLSLRGAAQERLRQFGLACQLQRSAWTHLRSPHHAKRMIACLTLGFLKWTDAQDLLRQRLSQGQSHTPIYAARSLLDIDAQLHASEVLEALLQKPALDFSLLAVLLKPHRAILQQVMLRYKPSELGEALDHGDASAARLVRWLRLARALQLQLPSAWLAPLLNERQELESLIAAIRLFQGEAGIDPILGLAQHPDWRVRSQVARSLAYVGDERCADVLVGMTTDREWWVRFRSAQALFQLPGVSVDSILERVARTGDRYAIQMVQSVQASEGGA